MTTRQPTRSRLIGGIVAAAILTSCGAIPFLEDDDTVTGTDEAALRASAEDALEAFVAGDSARSVAYIDPACGVSEARLEQVRIEAEAFVLAFTGLSLDDIYDSAEVVAVSVEGTIGTVTQVSNALPGFEATEAEPSEAAQPETESTETEWRVVEGRWVLPSCIEYLTIEESSEFADATDVRFDSDGSVIVLASAAQSAIDEGLEPDSTADIDEATGFDDAIEVAADTVPAPVETVPDPTAPPSTTPPAPPATQAPPPATVAPVPTKLDPALIVASVSSELPATDGITYGAANLLDGVLETAWNHCGDCVGGDGVGQRISFGFTQPVTVVGIRIANGYQKDTNNVFARNHRVAQMTVATLEATTSETLTVADTKGYQLFSFPRTTTTGLFMDIDAIHSGSGFPDLAVSEIEIFVLPTG